jgi:hypothetical protein
MDNVEYLGDAVYAIADGYGILLRVGDHRSEFGQIRLEPEVLIALNKFAAKHLEGFDSNGSV